MPAGDAGGKNPNRLKSIKYRGETTGFEYDHAGRLRTKTLPNGIRQELSYDDADRLGTLVYRNPDGTARVEYLPVIITRWPPGERVYGR